VRNAWPLFRTTTTRLIVLAFNGTILRHVCVCFAERETSSVQLTRDTKELLIALLYFQFRVELLKSFDHSGRKRGFY